MSKWILVIVLAVAIAAAILSNPDWRQHMGEPGGLIGSIKPRNESLTASTKPPNSSKSDSGSRVELPPPTMSVGDDASSQSRSAGSEALGGRLGPSPSATANPPASDSSPGPVANGTPAVGSSSSPSNPTTPTRLRPPVANSAPSVGPETASQISEILKSRDTSRGLVTMLPNALFEPGSALLGAAGNDKLSRIARVILAHPGIKVEVDSYTGPAEVFQSGLSVGRAASVRLFLVSQGLNDRDVTQRSVTVPPTQAAVGAELSRDVALVISGPAH